jgi:cell division cycle 20-like protein 1, cofactor of APC complex
LRQLQHCEYSDRLIPSRAASNLESGLGLLDENSCGGSSASTSLLSGQGPPSASSVRSTVRSWQSDDPGAAAFDRLLRSELLGPGSPEPQRREATERLEDELVRTPEKRGSLFRYKCQSEDGHSFLSPLRSSALNSPPRKARKIPHDPFRVLHAPRLEDDYYLSLLDYSAEDVLAVGLGSCVDLWSSRAGRATRLCNLGPHSLVSSVCWADARSDWGNHVLAIGTSQGEVQIWDTSVLKKVRTLTGHTRRVASLAWGDGPATLFSGAQDRDILRWDLRRPSTGSSPVARLRGHGQEVCGLTWSQDWQQLASGGNEGGVCVWSGRSSSPDLRLGEHEAAVKALSWSIHQRGLLATGGGTADRCVRLWNTISGTQAASAQTQSQVCNLCWSPAGDGELLSTHGYSGNEIIIWRQSGAGLARLHTVKWHQARVLYLAVSPDGQTVVTGAGNETLCFWNLLAPCKSRATSAGYPSKSFSETYSLCRTIR